MHHLFCSPIINTPFINVCNIRINTVLFSRHALKALQQFYVPFTHLHCFLQLESEVYSILIDPCEHFTALTFDFNGLFINLQSTELILSIQAWKQYNYGSLFLLEEYVVSILFSACLLLKLI